MESKTIKIYYALLRNRFNSMVIKSMDCAQLWDLAGEMVEDAENNGWSFVDEEDFVNYI